MISSTYAFSKKHRSLQLLVQLRIRYSLRQHRVNVKCIMISTRM